MLKRISEVLMISTTYSPRPRLLRGQPAITLFSLDGAKIFVVSSDQGFRRVF